MACPTSAGRSFAASLGAGWRAARASSRSRLMRSQRWRRAGSRRGGRRGGVARRRVPSPPSPAPRPGHPGGQRGRRVGRRLGGTVGRTLHARTDAPLALRGDRERCWPRRACPRTTGAQRLLCGRAPRRQPPARLGVHRGSLGEGAARAARPILAAHAASVAPSALVGALAQTMYRSSLASVLPNLAAGVPALEWVMTRRLGVARSCVLRFVQRPRWDGLDVGGRGHATTSVGDHREDETARE
jgi:hypothetical protein